MYNTENIYCCLCAELMSHKKLLNLNTDEEKCREIVNKLSRFNIEMNLNESFLPKTACFVCINSLEYAFDFITAVERAQKTLNNIILQKIKTEDKSDEENIVFEPPDHDFRIKVEPNTQSSISKIISLKNSKKITEKKKKQYKICNSLDALPLSQLKLTWKEYSWMCSYCETQFPNIDELRNHSMQYHNVCNPYRCIDCNVRRFHLDRFLIHVKRHRKYLKFSCYKCPMKFTSLLEGVKHKSTHITTNYTCFGCHTNFASEEELSKHTSTFFKEKRTREIPVQFQNDGLTCKICNKTLKSKYTLTQHMLTHTDREKSHICEICGKGFFQRINLVDHMILHSDARPYQCEICKSSFKTSRQLSAHIGTHDGLKPFACDQCGRCFRLNRQLTNHKIIHTDSLPHVCTICNKSFRFRTILSQHVRQHTGVKPYSCHVCKRDFTNWSNYNKHMKGKHDMNMAKKKHTPDGVYPIDAVTGQVKYPEGDKMLEWKKKMLERRRVGKGRPRLNKKGGKVVECKEEFVNKDSNNY